MIPLTQTLIDQWAAAERAHLATKDAIGGALFRDRIEAAARIACTMAHGDLIEIGCYGGATTLRLAAVAREFGRSIVTVDNWTPGTDYHLDEVERGARASLAPHADVVSIWKADAHMPETVARIQRRRWAFALSDDGHHYADHISELRTLLPVVDGIVAVDDVYYVPDVPDAIRDALAEFPGWMKLWAPGLRECYLIREGA